MPISNGCLPPHTDQPDAHVSEPQAHHGFPPTPPHDTPRLAAAAARTTLAAAFGQGLGVLVPIAVARQFGATAATDSFFFAFAAVSLVLTAAAGVGQASAIPDLVDAARRAPDTKLADHVASFLVMVTVTVCLGAAGVLTVWSGVPGAPGEAMWHVLALTPYAACAAAASVAAGVLAADRSFARVAASLALRWGITIAMLVVFGGRLGIGAAALGLAIGEAVRVVFLCVLVTRRRIWRPRLAFPRASPGLRGFFRNSAAQFMASLVLAATLLVDRVAVSTLGQGSVSLLEYAERLWQVPLGLAMTGVLAVAFTEWSHEAVRAGSVARASVARVALGGALATVPVAIGVWVSRGALTTMLFGTASLSQAELAALADLVGAFVAVTPLYVAGVMCARALLAERRGGWLLGVAVAQLTLKLATNGLAVEHFGLVGISLTTAGMYALALAVFGVALGRPVRRALGR